LARRHRRVAQVIETLYAQQLDELVSELAVHFDIGGETESAAHYYLRAAQRALAVYADGEALNALSRSLELSTDSRVRFAGLALRETIHRRRGAHANQGTDVQQLTELADSLDDENLKCEALHRQILLQRALNERETEAKLIENLKQRAAQSGQLHWQTEALQAEATHQMVLSQYDAARTTLERVLEQRQGLADTSGQSECYALLAEVAALQGHFEQAQHLLKIATTLAGSHTNQSLLVRTLKSAALAATIQQDSQTAYALGQQMLDLCRAIGDRAGEADAHARLGGTAARLFQVQEAREHYTQAAALHTVLGNRQGTAIVLVNESSLFGYLGHLEEAIAKAARAAVLFESLGDLRGQTISAICMAWYTLQTGNFLAAREVATQALAFAHELKSPVYEAYALANLGAAERDLGQLSVAISHMETGIALRRSLDQPVELATDLCDLTIAYVRQGNLTAAQQTTTEMLGLLAADLEHMTYPQYMLWAAAQTYRALGESEQAHDLLTQANTALQAKAAAIPDLESRTAFFQVSFNRDVLLAIDPAGREGTVPWIETPSARRSRTKSRWCRSSGRRPTRRSRPRSPGPGRAGTAPGRARPRSRRHRWPTRGPGRAPPGSGPGVVRQPRPAAA